MRILLRFKTGPPTCSQIARVLQSYLDGETDAGTAARVALHLKECGACAFDAETLEDIKDALGRLRRETDSGAMHRLTIYVRELREGRRA